MRGLPFLASTLLVLVAATAGRAGASEPDAAQRWAAPGWQRPASGSDGRSDDPAKLLQGLGTTSAPLRTATRVETLLLPGPELSHYLVGLLSVTVDVEEGRRAYGVRLPLVLGPLMQEPRMASGDLMLERHTVSSTRSRHRVSTMTWRLVLPSSTAERRLAAPGLRHVGAGLDWASARFYVAGEWRLHTEVGLGFRLDDEAPFQASATAAATRRLWGPAALYGQADSLLLTAPGAADGVLLTVGVKLDLGPAKALLAGRTLMSADERAHFVLALGVPGL